MANNISNQNAVNPSFVVNAIKGKVNVLVARQKEEIEKRPVKTIAGFAKNTRYSMYNNGGGYTGL